MELYEIAIKNSGWAWNSLREAKKHSYQIGEESITDFLVLNIKKWGSRKIVVNTFTRRKESVNGSDWEWWFTGPSGKWLGMRVQAKVLKLDSEKYEHLHYSNVNGQQVDLLIQDAKNNDLIPLYCMYTNWKPGDYKVGWKCKTYKPSIRHYGTAILNPTIVKQLQTRGLNHLKDVIGDLRPMHCIFCCSGFSGGDLPERALAWLIGAHLLIINNETPAETFLKDSPPDYVAQILHDEIKDDLIGLQDDRLKRVTIFKAVND
ncbi:hypothetical protein RBA69_19215 [Brenneria goodwinii]|uniref:DUF6615 family protein n=1 Tax=Brenneria goodwinii TaxID=1109412 RepID=UPI0036F05173